MLIMTIGIVSYAVQLMRGRIKPHVFSWLIWAIVTGIGFAAQWSANGGPGAWVNAFNSFCCVVIFLLSLKRGHRQFVTLDWIVLLLAFLAIILWWQTGQALTAVILVCFADVIGYIPTLRKTYHSPYSESLLIYWCSVIYQALAIAALSSYSLTTVLYPATLFTVNILFNLTVLWRRAQFQRG
jgi:hypothetical protein